eukprot:5817712-Pyramimonas_sp.AAC.1
MRTARRRGRQAACSRARPLPPQRLDERSIRAAPRRERHFQAKSVTSSPACARLDELASQQCAQCPSGSSILRNMSSAHRQKRHFAHPRGMGALSHSCHAFCNVDATTSRLKGKTFNLNKDPYWPA